MKNLVLASIFMGFWLITGCAQTNSNKPNSNDKARKVHQHNGKISKNTKKKHSNPILRNEPLCEGKILQIDATEKSFAFSRIAEPGKVSIFILSIPTCKPCVYLKNQLCEALSNGSIDSEYVDVYYCMLSKKSESLRDNHNNPAYIHFWKIDQATRIFPTTYIMTPTTNTYTYIEGFDQAKFGKIIEYANELSEKARYYFNLDYLYLEDDSNLENIDYSIQIEALKNEVKDLENENIKLKDHVFNLEKQLGHSRPANALIGPFEIIFSPNGSSSLELVFRFPDGIAKDRRKKIFESLKCESNNNRIFLSGITEYDDSYQKPYMDTKVIEDNAPFNVQYQLNNRELQIVLMDRNISIRKIQKRLHKDDSKYVIKVSYQYPPR